MTSLSEQPWRKELVSPEKALKAVQPGMTIFVGTGPAEPRTLVKKLMSTEAGNLQDLELIQLVSFGEAISVQELRTQKYRLKTFFSGWVAWEAVTEGRVDLIPSRFSRIPDLIRSGRLGIEAAFVQVSPPDASGYCSLGLAVDVAREAMSQSGLVVAEINEQVPRTYGDTFVHLSEFDHLVLAAEAPITLERWPMEAVYDQVAQNVASVIEDGSCLAWSTGPLYEALGPHLQQHRHLGIHSPFLTDSLMDLIVSGAVSNRRKRVFAGKSVACYAMGSKHLLAWLDQNPFVEFQPMEKVFDPIYIGRNPSFVTVLSARKVDLSGRIALHQGKGNVTAGPGEARDFVNGAELSQNGMTIFAMPSRNSQGESNIQLSVDNEPNLFNLGESVDMVVTECGLAYLRGRSVRERAMALIDIAHPEDRLNLVEQAKREKLLYQDQLYLQGAGKLYPDTMVTEKEFKGGLTVRFRPIKPSDEDGMRRLFYRFSDQAVYYRYFTPIKAQPHNRMQEYVNVDFDQTMSIVGLVGPPGQGEIIAEARYARARDSSWGDVAFLVDERYQGLGIATFMFQLLVRAARERCLRGFTADVLVENKAMLRVFEKGSSRAKVTMEQGVYSVTIPLDTDSTCALDETEGER